LPDADVEGFFRDTIKSYNGGNTDLWLLTKIDKIDKHNFIVPTVTTTGVKHANTVTINGNTMAFNQIHGNANAPLILYRMPVSDADAQQYKVDVSVQVLFPEGEYFGGSAVVPTLMKLSQIVTETLRAFEEFAVAGGAPVGVHRATS
jgi:hypothetical protein